MSSFSANKKIMNTIIYKYILFLSGAVVLIVVVIFLYKKNYISKLLLPERFKNYIFLSEGSIESENYEIVKIIDNWKGKAQIDGVVKLRHLFFDDLNKSFLLLTDFKNYTNQEYRIIWKINKRGEVIDSIKTDFWSMPYNSGIFFENDYFMDWINSGNKTKKEYAAIIDGDTISETEFTTFVNNATIIDVDLNHTNKIVQTFLNTDKEWIRIDSRKSYKNIDNDHDQILSNNKLSIYSEGYKKRFIELDNAIKPFHKWKDANSPLYIENFTTVSSQSKPFYDINNHGKSGWNGIGYFRLSHNSEYLHFKASIFNGKSFGYIPNISIYYPSKKNQDLVFINLYKNGYDNRHYKVSGLYMLRKKTFIDTE
ncbi:hypothetical protein [Aquimarina sp. RZ0]|uniref:hypothetical protein n=1 Tax=Aquimarina sp. RZ0 TaxID=2607730 RepID=UPI0011F26C51|nr:hypothetical protein [Aquimarina sp. RZ0]KAA1242650.1 hypothetical protein F0000_24670 [Aquimarina sp. RZ0]